VFATLYILTPGDDCAYKDFNEPLYWNTSKGESFTSAFAYAKSFNSDIKWDVSNGYDFAFMFYEAKNFEGRDLHGWDVSKAYRIRGMFQGCSKFDADISGWNVASVVYFTDMFREATSFKRDISAWNVSSVGSISRMLLNASSFNHDLNAWGDQLYGKISYQGFTPVPLEEVSLEVFTNSGCPHQPSPLKNGLYCHEKFSVYACLESAFKALNCTCEAKNETIHELRHSHCKTKYVDAGYQNRTFDAKVGAVYGVLCETG
jgi:surface protein